MKKTLLIFLLLLLGNSIGVLAQKDVKVTLEAVAEKCKDLSRDKRVTVKVACFNVSTKSAQANQSFGDELAIMLTSALQQTMWKP